MLFNVFGVSLFSLALPLAALADLHGHSHLNRHHDLAKRASGDMHIYKRFSSARWSFYDVEVGTGACGKWNAASSFTVALNSAQFGGGYPGPNCFKSITMTFNGKTTTATIMDECPGCPYGGLDLTRGLFDFFAPESEGIIYGEWSFNDGSGGGGAPAPPPPPPPPKTTTKAKPTSTWVPPPPTSTWIPPPPETTTSIKKTPTSTWTPPSTTSTHAASSTPSSSASSSVASSSAINYASGAASGLAVPTGTVVTSPDQPNNMNALNHLFIQLGGLVVGCANAK
ncbi:RlpA-like double-psi beta-barrel-protein domain-containing protein-containing protein [Crucibulum laeve]|uniref:RlpA-like double-psi beta-barrel-protein domain-containing protein-containing protein n=1 Tax=Crucibulum laeve TaxID=68775 RepID=A0A5C3MDW2_9AGAR|nr:RlpA-like double-psi beta-barrel-protein domain-containing protein-containing protein [Crucibulum laeve]